MLSPLESWALILSLIGLVALAARTWHRLPPADPPSKLADALAELGRTRPPARRDDRLTDGK